MLVEFAILNGEASTARTKQISATIAPT
jgi:hypothetical protein